EWLIGPGAVLGADPGDGLIGEIGRDVVAGVGRYFRRRMVAPHQRRELVGVVGQKAVEVLETLAAGPVVEGPEGGGVLGGQLIPFAESVGGIALVLEDAADAGGAGGNTGIVAGEPGSGVGV